MKKIFKYLLPLLLLAGASSCMENDMTLPRTRANFLAFNVENQESSTISNSGKTVTIVLDEYADMSAVVVDSIAITSGATCSNLPAAGDTLDMTSPLTYVLGIYYDYTWTVTASQPIERYVTCENQIGDAYFNLDEKDVTVYVSAAQDVTNLTITGMKLEPEGSEIVSTTGYADDGVTTETVACNFPDESLTVNCFLQRTFNVSYKGETIVWTMSVVQQQVSASITSVDAWCYHADIEASFDGNGDPYLAYRKRGTSAWTTFEDVTVNGVTVTATIPGTDTINESAERLDSGTTYEVKLCVGNSESDVATFTTETPDQIYNMDFEDWYQDGKVWYPVSEEEYNEHYEDKGWDWDSANKAVATFMTFNPTAPEESFVATSDSKYACKLENRYAVVKFAAASIFNGCFVGLDGLGAILHWGIPFTSRPRAIRGYYCYTPGYIDYEDNSKVTTEELDKCRIMVILTDWDGQFEINSTKEIFFDENTDENLIGFVKVDSDVDTGGQYVEFEYEIDYSRTATPKYVTVVACASCGGDYFTGSTSSVMYIDEFEFVYD